MQNKTELPLIETVQDHERGCGWRKPKALYLVSGKIGETCGKLPLPLHVCPTCGQGIKPSRGWTWVSPAALFNERPCTYDDRLKIKSCTDCPLDNVPIKQRMGLLWIGGTFYAAPRHWIEEAAKLGISRRIQAVPKGLKLSKDWVAVAHRRALKGSPCQACDGTGYLDRNLSSELWTPCKECRTTGKTWDPAIFHIFKPTRIEYVIEGDETVGELFDLRKRSITPVRVERVE